LKKNKNITLIIDGIQEKKGYNITIIDFNEKLSAPCAYFVICSANSKTQINAIADSIEEVLLKKLKLKKWHDEGRNSNWRLIDYSDIVIHILKEETRHYYNIEELWGDAIIEKI
tara:strand:- start:268 stop:609 length:342 start_codon:yes stop_codon:yes gene_type:complete